LRLRVHTSLWSFAHISMSSVIGSFPESRPRVTNRRTRPGAGLVDVEASNGWKLAANPLPQKICRG
jgi:hypothetical protein